MDIALPRKKKVIFVDGDFWHGRTIERLAVNRGEDDFWTKKIRRNMARDIEQRERLLERGWAVHVVWESELIRKKTQQEALEDIERFLAKTDE